MMTETVNHNVSAHGHDGHHDADERVVFGFWIYIMSDCVLFASIFAAYAVLHDSTFGGPGPRELFSLPYVLVETILLLTSSFTYGLAMLAAHKHSRNQVIGWLIVTFLLGAGFVAMEIHEFAHLIAEGNSWQRSAFLSSFFTLVGTHGLHVTVGLIWMVILMVQLSRHGLTSVTVRKLTCLSLFWHFLDIVWICVFSIVYLMGVM